MCGGRRIRLKPRYYQLHAVAEHEKSMDEIMEVMDGERVVKDGEVSGKVESRNRKGVVARF